MPLCEGGRRAEAVQRKSAFSSALSAVTHIRPPESSNVEPTTASRGRAQPAPRIGTDRDQLNPLSVHQVSALLIRLRYV